MELLQDTAAYITRLSFNGSKQASYLAGARGLRSTVVYVYLGLLLAEAVAGNATSEPHLGLPPRLPVGVLHVSDTAASVVVATLDVSRCRVGLAVSPTPGGEDGKAVARGHVDGVLAA